jgi:hypothetical protein
MNNKILFITVFISNLAFGAIVSLPTRVDAINIQEHQTLAKKSIEHLTKKGLEHKSATDCVASTLPLNSMLNEVMVQNILATLPSLKEDDIVSFIAQKSLHKESVDLSSYETLIALVQHTSRTLLDTETLEKLEQLSNSNERLKQGIV